MEQLDYNLLFRWFVGLSLERSAMGRDASADLLSASCRSYAEPLSDVLSSGANLDAAWQLQNSRLADRFVGALRLHDDGRSCDRRNRTEIRGAGAAARDGGTQFPMLRPQRQSVRPVLPDQPGRGSPAPDPHLG